MQIGIVNFASAVDARVNLVATGDIMLKLAADRILQCVRAEDTVARCTDGGDNDGDSMVDCLDMGCGAGQVSRPARELPAQRVPARGI